MTLETRSFAVREVAPESRTFAGVAVPWGVPADIAGLYSETFERGAVEIPDSGRVLLYWRHEEPIGTLTKHTDTERGWEVEARISQTPRGDEAYTLLRDGVIGELSIGFLPREHREDDATGDVTRTRVEVREVSLVPFGAYGQHAPITNVRNAAWAGTFGQVGRTSTTTSSTPINRKDGTMPDTTAAELTELRGTIEELERSIQTIATREPETPAVDTRSAGEILQAIARGDEGTIARYNELHARDYSGGTSADSPIKDAWVGDLTRIFDASSGVLARVFSVGTLPREGMNIEFAELASNTVQFDRQEAEGDDLATGKVTLTTRTAPVHTYGGYVQLTRQQIERSSLPILNRSLSALATAAGARKKIVLRTAFNTLVTARTAIASNGGVVVLGAVLGSSNAGHWENALIDTAIKYDAENAAPEALVVSGPVFKHLRGLTVSGERVFTVYNDNHSGSLNLPGLTGNLAGLPVYLDAGQTGNSAVFVHAEAIRQYDSALVSLQDENVVNLSKDFSAYRYGAIAPEVPQFVIPVKLAAS